MQTEKIYHYTSIESLAMILSTRKLRFSRLDTVDDVTEAQTHSGIQFGKYIFVNCWTQEEEDNLAQWKMYGGDMQGVRIELPSYPFGKILVQPIGDAKVYGELFSPLSNAEWYGRNYMVTSGAMHGDKFFAGPVEYVEDVASRYASAIVHTKGESGNDEIRIKNWYDLPRLKSKVWKFQAEYRFSLFVMPLVPPFPPGAPIAPTGDQLGNMSQAFFDGVDPGVRFIDVPLDLSVLDQMIIRTGPLCTAGGRVCIEALRDSLAPKAKVEASPLTDLVRRKN